MGRPARRAVVRNWVGPFVPVFVNDGLTLDFDEWCDPIPMIHFCFRVSEDNFNTILHRIKAAGIAVRSLRKQTRCSTSLSTQKCSQMSVDIGIC
jgi:hypothetical protein